MRLRSSIIILLVLAFGIILPLHAQRSVCWIKINDTAGGHDSLVFGNVTGATYGIDGSLGENASPPDPPNFFAKWINIPGRTNIWGAGLIKKDFRELPNLFPNPLHRDTFQLYIKNDDVAATNADVKISWPCLRYLQMTCDSILIVDPTDQLIHMPVNIFKTDSLILHDPYDAGNNTHAPVVKLLIFKYGLNADGLYECFAAPTVLTQGATDVTAIDATIHGFTTQGCEQLHHVTFQYGTTTAYGNEIAATAGHSNRYSAPLAGLKPNTTYHYRNASYFYTIDCSVPYEVIYGEDSTFTTSPPSSIFWITIDDGYYGRIDSMVFGNHIFGTYDVDTLIGENIFTEAPPGPFARWESIPGRVNTWGFGLLRKDLRGMMNPSKQDTFELAFKDGTIDAINAAATLHWQSASYLQNRVDSIFLDDPTHTLIPAPINMFTTDSVVLDKPFDSSGPNPRAPLVILRIYKYGTHLPTLDAVKPTPPPLPTAFTLYQNYPNPFNPSTAISFDLPKETFVTLSVYDLLGREVARLVNERRPAGRYTVQLDGSKLSSGIYFYRLTGGGVSFTKKMMVLK